MKFQNTVIYISEFYILKVVILMSILFPQGIYEHIIIYCSLKIAPILVEVEYYCRTEEIKLRNFTFA